LEGANQMLFYSTEKPFPAEALTGFENIQRAFLNLMQGGRD
jgi:hypothetical protein